MNADETQRQLKRLADNYKLLERLMYAINDCMFDLKKRVEALESHQKEKQ